VRRLGAIVLACAIAGAAPGLAGGSPGATSAAHGAAGAQVSVTFYGGGPAVATTIPARVTGAVTVQFRGDSAAGCARRGLCGYRGTIVWQPASRTSLQVITAGARHPVTVVSLFPSGLPPGDGVTSAHVILSGATSSPTHCVDVASPAQQLNFPVQHGRATVSLRNALPSLLATRCAGPRDADVIPLLPAPVVSVAALRHGRTTVPLSASHPFIAHGFSGSVISTVVLRLGRPGRTQRISGASTGPERVRQLEVHYRVTVHSTVAEQISGTRNPIVCEALGTCGLSGTITLTPHAQTQALISAQQLTREPVRTLRAAVGLDSGPSRGIAALGFAGWVRGGAIASDLTQGTERCRDAGALGGGALLVTTRRGRATIAYSVGGAFSEASSMTRCPGPLPKVDTAATTTVPVSTLRSRRVRLSLTAPSSTTDAGYLIKFLPHVTVTLTRLRTRMRILHFPAGSPIP
jgi:hypothetical protein